MIGAEFMSKRRRWEIVHLHQRGGEKEWEAKEREKESDGLSSGEVEGRVSFVTPNPMFEAVSC